MHTRLHDHPFTRSFMFRTHSGIIYLNGTQARDKKLRGLKSRGIINQLTEEMVYTSKLEIGFCDSDDDSDDEEEDCDDEEAVAQQRKRELQGKTNRTPNKTQSSGATRRSSAANFVAYRRDSNLRHDATHTHAHAEAAVKHKTRRLSSSSTKRMEMTSVAAHQKTVCSIKGLCEFFLHDISCGDKVNAA